MPLSEVFLKLSENISNGETKAIELWIKYRIGLPKQVIDNNVTVTDFNIKDIVKFE